jgi:hypothetical protein
MVFQENVNSFLSCNPPAFISIGYESNLVIFLHYAFSIFNPQLLMASRPSKNRAATRLPTT